MVGIVTIGSTGTLDPTRMPASAPSRRVRHALVLLAVLTVLVVVNLSALVVSGGLWFLAGPVVAAVLVMLARVAGLSWADLGLGRHSARRGAVYAAVAVAAVALVYLAGALLPATSSAFLDSRYQLAIGPALLLALVTIPLHTVLLEEVAFRGVLLGLVRHRIGTRGAVLVSSALFGLWHIVPSLRLGAQNEALGSAVGSSGWAQVLVVAGTVAFTGAAGVLFCELRRRSGSVLAPAGLHWATNGLGVLVSALLWAVAA